MLNQHFNSQLLDLKDVIIDSVENKEFEVHISAHLLEQDIRTCPRCNSNHCHIHDHRVQIIKELPCFGKKTYIHLDKRRYACQDCGKRFYERNEIVPKYYHCSSRLIAHTIISFKETVSATHIAKEHNISTTTAIRYFDVVEHKCTYMPSVLSIDEFKGNANGQKYQCILTNPNKKTLVDILPNRFECDLIEYFRKYTTRDNVKYFITDMNPHFLRVAKICFPKATVVVDKFHVIRQVNWAVERIRKNEQAALSDKFRIYFKRSKSLIYKNYNKLNIDEIEKLALMLEISPRLAHAYRLYWRFMDVMNSKNSLEGKQKLGKWLFDAEVNNLPEFKDALTAIHNWDKYIINSFDCPYTNGYTEGCNNRTKVLKRACYGIQRFDRLRNRIMYIAS